jgi:hypothetical protein
VIIHPSTSTTPLILKRGLRLLVLMVHCLLSVSHGRSRYWLWVKLGRTKYLVL